MNVFKGKFFVTILLALMLCVVALPSAHAAPLLRLEFKAIPEKIVPGSIIDIPLYLVENRNGTEQSLFEGPYASHPGPFPLSRVFSTMQSTHSRFISLTPVQEFTDLRKVTLRDDYISFNFDSRNGIDVTIDNGGLNGRTEILIAILKVEVGPAIPVDDGIGGPDADIVFEVELSPGPAIYHNAERRLSETGYQVLNGLTPNTVIVRGEPKATPTPSPTPTPIIPTGQRGKLKFAAGHLYYNVAQDDIFPSYTCVGNEGDHCSGAIKLFKKKKVKKKGRTVTKKITYGTCTVETILVPFTTFCQMKLKRSAKKILKKGKSLKATLQFSTKGVKRKVKKTVQIKPLSF